MHRYYRRILPVGLALLLAAGLFGLSSCALFGLDDDLGFDVPISTTQSFTVPINLSALPTSGTTAPERLEIPLDLPAAPIDLAEASSEFSSKKDKLEKIEITNLKVTPKSNTLTGDLPPMELYIGPVDASSAADGELIYTIPVIAAGSTTEVYGTRDDAGMDAAQTHLLSLSFSFVPSAVLIVEQGDEVPGGAAELEFEIEITATVDPLK